MKKIILLVILFCFSVVSPALSWTIYNGPEAVVDAHEAEADPHPGYLTEDAFGTYTSTSGDTVTNAVFGAYTAGHTAGDTHSIYLLDSAFDAYTGNVNAETLDGLDSTAFLLDSAFQTYTGLRHDDLYVNETDFSNYTSGHTAAVDPHTQYLFDTAFATYTGQRHDDVYLLLTGGTLTGDLNVQGDVVFNNASTAGSVQAARFIANQGTAANPAYNIGDKDTGFYESSDDVMTFAASGVPRFSLAAAGIWSSTGFSVLNNTPSATVPSLLPVSSDADTGIGSAGANQLSLITGGAERVNISSGGATVTGEVGTTSWFRFDTNNRGFYPNGAFNYFFDNDQGRAMTIPVQRAGFAEPSVNIAGWSTDTPYAALNFDTMAMQSVSASTNQTQYDNTATTFFMDASGGNKTVTLRPASETLDRVVIVQKIPTDTTTNTVTINPDGVETIGGLSDFVLDSPGQTVILQHDRGTDWKVLFFHDPRFGESLGANLSYDAPNGGAYEGMTTAGVWYKNTDWTAKTNFENFSASVSGGSITCLSGCDGKYRVNLSNSLRGNTGSTITQGIFVDDILADDFPREMTKGPERLVAYRNLSTATGSNTVWDTYSSLETMQYPDTDVIKIDENVGTADPDFVLVTRYDNVDIPHSVKLQNSLYDGGHTIKFKALNCQTSTWVNLRDSTGKEFASDVPDALGTDFYRRQSFEYVFPDNANDFVCNNEVRLQYYHTGTGVNAHSVEIDSITLVDRVNSIPFPSHHEVDLVEGNKITLKFKTDLPYTHMIKDHIDMSIIRIGD